MIVSGVSLKMEIKDIFYEERYYNILYYLKENGVVYCNELLDFDINQLLFVPGTTEEILNGVIGLVNSIKSLKNKEMINLSDTPEADHYVTQPDVDLNMGKVAVYEEEKEESDCSRNSIMTVCTHESDEVLIDEVFSNIPHGGLLIRHCNKLGIKYVNELRDFSFDAEGIKGIGYASMQKLHKEYLKFLNSAYSQETYDDLIAIISDINKRIPIRLLHHFGLGEDIIKELSDKGCTYIADICNSKLLTSRQYLNIVKLRGFFVVPIDKQFENILNEQKDMPKRCLFQRIQGLTLQIIADDNRITRERVRQIINKICENLLIYAELIGA